MRNYAALPHEYLEEMAQLTDEEFGRLVRGLLRYSMAGEAFEPVGNEQFYVPRVMMQEDRYQASYNELTQKRSEAGKKAALARWSREQGAYADACNTETETKPKPNQNHTTLPRSAERRKAGERMRQDMESLIRMEQEGIL